MGKSNLANKLQNICNPENNFSEVNHTDNTFGKNNLTDEQIKQVEQELINHFEFDKIVWMEYPSGLTEDGKPIVAKSIKISDNDNPTYKHKVGYIYKLMWTPKVYSPEELNTPVKDGTILTPIIYNPETYEPKQSIKIVWNPEVPQSLDDTGLTFEEQKQMLHDKLENALNNPEEYLPVGYRGCILRYAVD